MSLGVLKKVVGRMAIADELEEAEPDMTEFNKLTLREQEILDVMIQGLSDRETAATLVTSKRMIRCYVRNMLNRLDGGERSQLMCYSTP